MARELTQIDKADAAVIGSGAVGLAVTRALAMRGR